MYRLKETKDIDEFDKFVINNKGSFFQTSMGALMKNNWRPVYLTMVDNNDKIVLTILLLTRRILKFIKMGYIHSGFAYSKQDENLYQEAIHLFNNYIKDKKIDFVFIDHEIPLYINDKVNKDGEKIIEIYKQNKIPLSSKKEPFIQPRFGYVINLQDNEGKTKTIDDVVAGFEKGVRYSIRTASNKGLKYECYSYDDIKDNPKLLDEFLSIMSDTMDRLETTVRSKSYYMNVLDNLKEYATLDLVCYDYKEDKNNNDKNLELLKTLDEKKDKNKITEVKSKIKAYNRRLEELKNYNIDMKKIKKLYLAGGITVFFNLTTTCLYGGTKNVLRNLTRSSHYLNYKRIENSIKKNMKYHDLLRAHVFYRDKRDKNYGLSLFKKSLGADEIEYVPEYVFVNNKASYYLFKLFYKKFLKLILFLKKKVKK